MNIHARFRRKKKGWSLTEQSGMLRRATHRIAEATERAAGLPRDDPAAKEAAQEIEAAARLARSRPSKWHKA